MTSDSTPVDQMLDMIEWTPTNAQPSDDGLPYATHRGVLNIGEFEFEVFVLSDGRPILSADSVNRLLRVGGEPA